MEKSALKENSALQEKFHSKFEQNTESLNFLLEKKTQKILPEILMPEI